MEAKQAYDQNYMTIVAQLDELRHLIVAHKTDYYTSGEMDHWTYAGDLGHVKGILQEALDFFNGSEN